MPTQPRLSKRWCEYPRISLQLVYLVFIQQVDEPSPLRVRLADAVTKRTCTRAAKIDLMRRVWRLEYGKWEPGRTSSNQLDRFIQATSAICAVHSLQNRWTLGMNLRGTLRARYRKCGSGKLPTSRAAEFLNERGWLTILVLTYRT